MFVPLMNTLAPATGRLDTPSTTVPATLPFCTCEYADGAMEAMSASADSTPRATNIRTFMA